MLEFHFTDNRKGKKFRDHKVSLTNKEVKSLIKNIKLQSSYFGDGVKKLLKIEKIITIILTFQENYTQKDEF